MVAKKASPAKKTAAKKAAPVKKTTAAKKAAPRMSAPQVNRVSNAEPVSAVAPLDTPAVAVPSRLPQTPHDIANEQLRRIAKEVLAGQWNSKVGRDDRLRAAGHDPDLVKAEITKLKAAK